MLTSAGVVWKSTIRCKFPSDYVISIKQIDYVISTKQIDYVISTKQSAWRNLRGSALHTIVSLREVNEVQPKFHFVA